jgi:DNA-binding transcriptional MerR regulator
MIYTINKLAKSAGVTVRTLHFYDEIGLLKPSRKKENSYRTYSEKDMLRLQQILFYRELEFSLEDIRKMLESPDFNALEALRDHKKLLEIKRKRIETLIETIDKTMKSMKSASSRLSADKGGDIMNNDDLYTGFSKDKLKEYQEEAKQRWGDTDAYKQSTTRTKNWTKQDYRNAAKQQEEITNTIAGLMDKGIQDHKVQEQIERHYKYISQFYKCSYEMYRNLGKMYVDDKRFTEYYDKREPRLALFMRDAMAYYCYVHEKKV